MLDLKKYLFIIFFLLFPADIIFYLTQIMGYGNFPVGILAYILSFPLLFLFINQFVNIKAGYSVWIFLAIFLAFLAMSIIPVLASGNDDFLDYFLVMKYLLNFIIGFYLFQVLEDEKFRRIIFFVNIGTAIGIILLFINMKKQLFLDDHLNYLRLSESLVFMGLTVVISVKYKIQKHFLFLIFMLALFFLSSRSALFGFIFVYAIYLFLEYGIRYIVKAIMATSIIFTPIIIMYSDSLDFLLKNRVFILLLYSEDDGSFAERTRLFNLGIERIVKNPFLGDFKGQLAYGEYGAYIHNILSYWAQFGLIDFILITSIIFTGIIFFWKRFKQFKEQYIFKLSMFFFIYCLILSFAARSFVYMNLYIALGLMFQLFVNQNVSDQKQERNHPDTNMIL